MTYWPRPAVLILFAAFLFAAFLLAPGLTPKDNYEIQVYAAETQAPHSTMVEIHSNFTVSGSKTVEDGMLPTNHAEHETLELTQGINNWAEVGFYLFSSIQPDGGWQWVGDHIRPIVDRKIGPWYLAFNPALDRWFHGPGVNQGVTFSPTQRSATTSRRRLPADWNTTWNTTRPMVRYPTSPLSEISSSNSSPRSTSISLQNGSLTLESE